MKRSRALRGRNPARNSRADGAPIAFAAVSFLEQVNLGEEEVNHRLLLAVEPPGVAEAACSC